jgi:hypothetical protein
MNDFLQSLRNGQAEKPRTPKTRKNYDNSYHYTSPPRFQSYGGYPNNRHQQMKRPPVPHQPGNQLPLPDESTVTAMLAEAIESLSRHIETLANNQDYLVTVQERTAEMLERQVIAIEKIVEHLNIGPGSDIDTLAPAHKNETIKQPLKHHYTTSAEPEADLAPVTPTEAGAVEPAEPAKQSKPAVKRRKKIVSKKVTTAAVKDSKLMSREAIMDIIQTMRKEGATYDQVASRLIELGQPTFSGRGEWHAQTIHRLCSKK